METGRLNHGILKLYHPLTPANLSLPYRHPHGGFHLGHATGVPTTTFSREYLS
jgi:hypothetical protein